MAPKFFECDIEARRIGFEIGGTGVALEDYFAVVADEGHFIIQICLGLVGERFSVMALSPSSGPRSR